MRRWSNKNRYHGVIRDNGGDGGDRRYIWHSLRSEESSFLDVIMSDCQMTNTPWHHVIYAECHWTKAKVGTRHLQRWQEIMSSDPRNIALQPKRACLEIWTQSIDPLSTIKVPAFIIYRSLIFLLRYQTGNILQSHIIWGLSLGFWLRNQNFSAF